MPAVRLFERCMESVRRLVQFYANVSGNRSSHRLRIDHEPLFVSGARGGCDSEGEEWGGCDALRSREDADGVGVGRADRRQDAVADAYAGLDESVNEPCEVVL